MSKSNISRLLKAFIPFSIMVLFQRGLLLIFGYINFVGEIADILAFVPAAAVCIAAFYLVGINVVEDEEAEFIPPLKKQRKSVAILACAVALAVMIGMMYAVTSLLDGTLADTVTLSPFSVISLVIIHPILEEWVFRGLIYREMRRMNPVFATLASAVMFAIVHNTVNGMLYALVAGIALAALVEVTGRVIPSVFAHMLINARSLLYITLFYGADATRRTIDTVIFVLGAVSLIGVLVIVGRDATAETEAATLEVEEDDA